MFAGLRRVVTAKKHVRTVRLKSAAKFENKTYHHFTPIKGQASALISHAGRSKSFFGMFKETSLACLFDVGGLFAGFMIAVQLGVFQLSPWAIALYPAIVSVKGVISGLLTGRLSTALHLGTVYPKFFGNTKSFYKLIEAMVVLTLATSATISVIAILFGTLFWGGNNG